MDIKELRGMPLPKLKERAKEVTDLEGVIGMKKEALVQAIAKAEGIAYETPRKDVATIRSIKQEIRGLREQKQAVLTSSQDHSQLRRIRKKVKRLRHLTRKLAREGGRRAAEQPAAAPEAPAAGAPTATSG